MSSEMTSTKPYIVRAFYEWICDNGLTPYIAVDANVYGVLVPQAYVNDGQIVLNISPSAVGAISLAGDEIEFSARFGGKLEHLVIPFGAIGAIYAKENGAGTSLAIEHPPEPTEQSTEEEKPKSLSSVPKTESEASAEPSDKKSKSKGRASLKVVK